MSMMMSKSKSKTKTKTKTMTMSKTKTMTMSNQIPMKLGEGTYGCVYKPAFKCDGEDSTKITAPHVGKVFFDDIDAKIEIDIANILQGFGEEANKYLIIPIKSCNTDPIENHEIRKCNIPKDRINSQNITIKDKSILQRRRSFIQQIIPYGGITLYDAIYKKDTTLLDWLYSLLGTFKALEYLHSKGYAHLDIKSDNIVLSDNIRLLDFGFMTSLDNIYTNNIYNLAGSYRIYPFELRIHWLENITENDYNIDKIINEFLSEYKRVRKINREDIKKTVVPKIFNKKLLREASTKIDVYSVGIMCLNEHPLLIHIENEYGFDKYIKFLQNIIDIDFTKRYSSSKAISELQKIINDIEKK